MNSSRPVRVGITVLPPYTTACADAPPVLLATRDCPRPGWANQVLGYLLQSAKMEAQVLPEPKPLVWGSPTREGSAFCEGWTGVLGGILNGTYDTVSSLWTLTPQRSRCFAFSNPVMFQHSVIILKNVEDPSESVAALFRVYAPEVWLLAALTTLLTSLFLGITYHIFAVEEREKRRGVLAHISQSFWTCIMFISDQLSTLPECGAMRTHTARWLLSFLGLFALFFLKLYEGGLLTEILSSSKISPFKNAAELGEAVAAGRVRPGPEARPVRLVPKLPGGASDDQPQDHLSWVDEDLHREFISDQLSTLPECGATRTHTARWLLSFLGLFALFFLKLYEGGLLTEILSSSKISPFKSAAVPCAGLSWPIRSISLEEAAELGEAVAAGRATYVIARETWFEDYLRDERLAAMGPLREALRLNPSGIVRMPDNKASMEYVRSRPAGSVGFHASQGSSAGLVQCGEVALIDHHLPGIRSAFIFAKNNTALVSRLNAEINAATAHINYVQRRYDRPEESCRQEQRFVTMHNLVGMLALGGAMISAALLAFLVELLCGRWRRKRSMPVVSVQERRDTENQAGAVVAGPGDKAGLPVLCDECGTSVVRRRRLKPLPDEATP